MYMYICTYIYIYIKREREREIERDRGGRERENHILQSSWHSWSSTKSPFCTLSGLSRTHIFWRQWSLQPSHIYTYILYMNIHTNIYI